MMGGQFGQFLLSQSVQNNGMHKRPYDRVRHDRNYDCRVVRFLLSRLSLRVSGATLGMIRHPLHDRAYQIAKTG